MSGDPFDPFASDRQASGFADCVVGDDEFVMVLRYDDLKEVTRDWERFTSDAPFRVSIPPEHNLRSVRQLPIEVDPPEHTGYREIVKDIFSIRRATQIEPTVRRVVDDLLTSALGAGSTEVVRSFALPIQSRSLAAMLGRGDEEAETWISWGTDVYYDTSDNPDGHASELDRYLEGAIAAAVATPGDDFFGVLARGEIEGRPLSSEEMMGIANLTFTAGRDTIIHSISNSLHYLARNREAFERLRAEPGLIRTAREEFLRYFSPLTHIGRIVRTQAGIGSRHLDTDSVLSICFASANRDESVFEGAGEIDLGRKPNRHVAFGHGPHTCLGAPLTRTVLTALLDALVDRVGRMWVMDESPQWKHLGKLSRQTGFHHVTLGLEPT